MSQTYDCPNCGGAVIFQTSIAVFAVCPHCGSMVVRHDVNVEAIGRMAQLPPDLSPLQLGAHGEFDGQGFTLIGRVRAGYDEGTWNEWCALFGDGRYGWIAEAQGVFMASFENAPPPEFPDASGLQTGHELEIDGQNYRVTDRKEKVCLGAEGELPFLGTPDRKTTSVDLTGHDGRFASVEYSDSGARLFIGRYAQFDDLKFTGLRAVPGWSGEDPEIRHHQTTSLKCPNCGGTVELRAAGFSMSATCGSCGSLIDTATPELTVIRRASEQLRTPPDLPLGLRGVLFGVNYEVIGFQRVKDQYCSWKEYLLFNPWQGFVWLVTYNGHWSFVRRIFARPEVSEGIMVNASSYAKFEGSSYRIFAASEVSTVYVLGEFYWKVSVGMPVHVTDFVCPPRILSREAYPQLGEETWSQGEYIEASILQEAFNLEQPLPEPTGIYLNQPNPYSEKGRRLKWLAPLFLLLLLAIQVVSANRAAREQVFAADYVYHAGLTNPLVVTPPFEIKGGNQTLEISVQAPVDNNWLELDVDLVNTNSQLVAATFEQGIEYYHGYDDGNWSEGRQTEHRLIPAVAPGIYSLTIDASADPNITEIPVHVTAVRDVVIWSNFWIAAALLLAYPIYCGIRHHAFERARWLESDYSPYSSSDDSDDDDD